MAIGRPLMFSVALVGLLSGCSGGGGAAPPSGTVPAASVVTAAAASAPLASCPSGGITVDAGVDDNRNGLLDAAEVDVTQYVCHGTNGTDGANAVASLVSVSDEAAGSHCASGGKRITSGPDADASGLLDPAEVSNTDYICNGADGTNGTNGADGATGINSLLAISGEAVGSNCPHGGSKITAGQDLNGNATLDAAEVTATTYTCNGAPGPGITWKEVTGTAQAVANAGYLANDVERVTITLPASPAIGDTVAVSGTGEGGWKIAQNDGQSIVTRALPHTYGALWSARTLNRSWTSVASSADGRKLVAAASGGQLYTSTDSGETWKARELARSWAAVASSADGSKLVAAANQGQLYTSTDSGEHWTVCATTQNLDWYSVASSADGSKLVAAAYGGQIYTSTDSGVSWTARGSVRTWFSVASSADGSKLVAASANSDGRLYTSIDSGVTWMPPASPAGGWISVASSADGSKLVAADQFGQLYTSNDSGLNWIGHESPRYWLSVASSADGNRLVAAAGGGGGHLYHSIDSGLGWTARAPAGNWGTVASSADGSKLVAGIYGGAVYTSEPRTTIGPAGALLGAQWESVELQYAGGGTWMINRYVGEPDIQ